MSVCCSFPLTELEEDWGWSESNEGERWCVFLYPVFCDFVWLLHTFLFILIFVLFRQVNEWTDVALELCCWKLILCCLLLKLCHPPLSSPLLSRSMAFYLEEVMNCTRSLLLVVSGWVPRHVIGAVLVSLPAISVLSHLTRSVHLPLQVNMSVGGW